MATRQVILRRVGPTGIRGVHIYEEEAEVSRDAIAQALTRIKAERGGDTYEFYPIGVAFKEDVVRDLSVIYKETNQNLIL